MIILRWRNNLNRWHWFQLLSENFTSSKGEFSSRFELIIDNHILIDIIILIILSEHQGVQLNLLNFRRCSNFDVCLNYLHRVHLRLDCGESRGSSLDGKGRWCHILTVLSRQDLFLFFVNGVFRIKELLLGVNELTWGPHLLHTLFGL